MKKTILAVSMVAVLAVSALLGGCSSGGGGGMFGKVPQIYEEKMLTALDKIMEATNNGKEVSDLSAALAVLGSIQEMMDEAKEEAQPYVEKMKGKSIAYTVSDSLPYKIVSEIKIDSVIMPELNLFGGSSTSVSLQVKFDVVMTEKSDNMHRMRFFVMAGDKAYGYDDLSANFSGTAADTLRITAKILSPDMPAKNVMECNSLKFVTDYEYNSKKGEIRELQKTLSKELKEKLEKKFDVKKD